MEVEEPIRVAAPVSSSSDFSPHTNVGDGMPITIRVVGVGTADRNEAGDSIDPESKLSPGNSSIAPAK